MEKESPTRNSTTTRTKIRDDATRTKTGTEVVCGYATYVAIMPSLPYTAVVAGPTGCGKTAWSCDLSTMYGK